jgi:hypothetical protein
VKKTALWISAFGALAIPALADTSDIVGWQNARWGMTLDDVQRILKYPASRADLAKVCGEACPEGAALELEDYVLSDQHFTVRLWFTKDDMQLHTISMYAKRMDKESYLTAFEKIKRFSEGLYGPPRSVTLKHGNFKVLWALKSTKITLYSNATDEMTLVYEENIEGKTEGGMSAPPP